LFSKFITSQESVIYGKYVITAVYFSEFFRAGDFHFFRNFVNRQIPYDVGVAGIHRLFARLDVIRAANVLIVVAGMEGALASVVSGLVDKPVIAVPTSVGYGANFGGLSALLTMLNSCAAGIGVVNIDNGFGAGFLASMINKL